MLRVADHFERSDTGRARRENEDSFYARSPMFAVADGMGGAQAGEVASQTAVGVFSAEGGLPDEELPLLPSGRIDRAAADAVFPAYQAAAEADPGNWRTWYRLGLAYDASGDRRRARWAMRQSIRRSRGSRP